LKVLNFSINVINYTTSRHSQELKDLTRDSQQESE